MSEYRCSQCGEVYTHPGYRALDTTSRVTDDPDDEYGVETVCECGAGFHSDRWNLQDTVDTEQGEIHISTVALLIPHGPDRTGWFETCLFHDHGSRVIRRYETQEEAEGGHSELVDTLMAGGFEFVPTSQRIEVDES